ncbi:MAG TPA: hypothetical protein VMG99_07970 [Thermoplasmata archaeon]|nr:hypothetical protein [Thermoplasmata archaeon]
MTASVTSRTLLALVVVAVGLGPALAPAPLAVPAHLGPAASAPTTPAPVANFTSSINRLVELLALAGSGILALVWARVAFSWFSNDITKKVQAKDRARDALIGTLLFVAAVTGLVWGLAHWVITGS